MAKVQIAVPVTRADADAMQRATDALASGRRIEALGGGRYRMQSSSEPGVWRHVQVVNVPELLATCDCPFGLHGDQARGRCWHAAAALSAEVRRLARVPVPGPSQAKRRLSDGEVAARMRQLFSR